MPISFDNPGAFDPLTVPLVASFPDANGILRTATVRAVVVTGAGQSPSAGSLGHSETADRFSVVVSRREWPFPFSPKVNGSFTSETFGKLIVKHVQASEVDFSCRCTKDERRRAP